MNQIFNATHFLFKAITSVKKKKKQIKKIPCPALGLPAPISEPFLES